MNSPKESEKIKLKEGYKIQDGVLYYLYKLKDGRIIALGEDNTFTLLNPSQTYKTDLQMKIPCSRVCQLENGLIVTVGNDITLWQLTQNELKKEFTIENKLENVIPLTKNRFAGALKDIIYIYSGNAPYNKEPIAKLEGHKLNEDCQLQFLQLKGKEILISAKRWDSVRFWDLNTYTQTKKIAIGSELYASNLFMQIDEDHIMMNRFIFTMSTGELKEWKNDEDNEMTDGFVRSDGKVVVTCNFNQGDWGSSQSFIVYDQKTGAFDKTDWKELWYLNSLVVLDEHTIVAGCRLVNSSSDENLKVFTY